ncbi:MAG: hypothetical protein MMC33_007303 [Icmadophila ericetorum]|nr:hypothetical protein [Icmadophila ericetorum]
MATVLRTSPSKHNAISERHLYPDREHEPSSTPSKSGAHELVNTLGLNGDPRSQLLFGNYIVLSLASRSTSAFQRNSILELYDENTESIASRLGSIENHLGAMAKGTASLHKRVAAIEQCPGKPVDGTPSICNSMQRGQDPIQSNPSPMDGLD